MTTREGLVKHWDVVVAWKEGAEVEFRWGLGEWMSTTNPLWTKGFKYRVKEVPLTKPTVPWDYISDEYQWAARDEDGYIYLYSAMPVSHLREVSWCWVTAGMLSATAFKGVTKGTCDWKDSLIKRPTEENKNDL